MKCPNCGAEIPKNEVVCPICGYGLQLVPDYNTVDSMLHEKEKKEKEEEEKKQKVLREAKKSKRISKSFVIGRTILVLVLTGVIGGSFVYLIRERASRDPFVLKSDTERLISAGRYEEAGKNLDILISMDGNADDLVLLRARVLIKEEKSKEAEELLLHLLDQNPLYEEAGEELMELYIAGGNSDEAAAFLKKSTNETLREKYSDYLPMAVSFSLMDGTYPEGTRLRLSADGGTIYYTTDGSDPDETSAAYHGTPLVLRVGDNVVKAVCINSRGVAGEIVTGTFTIKSEAPAAPDITPESGSYEAGSQRIRVSSSVSGTIYYTFDGTPTVESTVYDGPVYMPKGTHIFSAIVIDADGETSEVASRTYNVS